MIPGLGVDVVEVARIRRLLSRRGERFLARVFTAGERATAGEGPLMAQRLAGRFAAKEAVFKALGLGMGELGWQDVEIRGGRGMPPRVHLRGGAAAVARREGVWLAVSISHTREHAAAVAVAHRGDA